MRVKEVMTAPVVTVPPDLRVKQAAALLVEHAIGALPVVQDGALVGREAAPDPRAHAIPVPAPAADAGELVRDVMTREVVSLPEDADAADAARLMLEHRIASIPVVAGRRVVGIVARRDLLRVLVRADQEIATNVERLLAEELGVAPDWRVTVRDGVVELTGGDPADRRLATLLARSVPGVVAVRSTEG